MNKYAKTAILAITMIAAATLFAGIMSVSTEANDPVKVNTHIPIDTPTPILTSTSAPEETPTVIKSKDGFRIDEKRNFTGVEFEFMAHNFEMEGWIMWDGNMYSVECDGYAYWEDRGDVYCFVISNENEGVIGINHGYGATVFDQKLQYRLKKAILEKM